MKRSKTILFFSFIVLLFSFSSGADAATFSVTPSSFRDQTGSALDFVVLLDPRGVKNYTTKLVMNFPADLLAVKSFKLSDEWLPLNQPGYDLIDNNKGTLVKTAGFPKGTDKTVIFGVINFKVLKAGRDAITISENSLSYGVLGENILSGLPIKSEVIISEAKKTSVKKTQVKKPVEKIAEALVEEGDLIADEFEKKSPEEPTLFDIEIRQAPIEKENKFSLAIIVLSAIVFLSLAIYLIRKKSV
ncbi:MAG TPA: hypothetical protein VJ103_00525 [Candidatus Paceibacterota bacterium]|nr:hypothetical protein [Candidatus Paceibacterota bacterium]